MPQVVIVSSLGPQGPIGPQGPVGPTGSFDNITGSFATTASFNAFTSSYNTASFTGSFVGSGAGLYNIPASGITGLNLSQIATGSVSASVSTGTGSFTITSGSSNFVFVSSSGNVGIGTATPLSRLHIKNSTPSYLGGLILEKSDASLTYNLYVDGSNSFAVSKGASQFFTVDQSGNVGIGISTPTAKLQVRGTGATSSTTSLLVQNSAATTLFSIADNGAINIGAGNITTFTGTVQNFTGPIQALYFANAGSPFNFGTTAMVSITGTAPVITSGQRDVFLGQFTFAPTSGTAILNVFNASPTVNQTGGANGITRGLYVNPTLTSAADFRAIETTTGSVTFGGNTQVTVTGSLVVSGSTNLTALTSSNAFITGNVTVLGTASINTLIVNQTQLSTGSNQLGDAVNDTQTLYGTVVIPTGSLTVTGSTNIVGQSTGSSTTSLLVQNNSGYAALKVRDDVNSAGGFVIGTSSGLPAILSSNGSQKILRITTNGSEAYLTSADLTVLQGGGAAEIGVRPTYSYILGNFSIGLGYNTTPSARTHIKGSGTTSSTTSLLVQNSAASTAMQITDDLGIIFPGKGQDSSGVYIGRNVAASWTNSAGSIVIGDAADVASNAINQTIIGKEAKGVSSGNVNIGYRAGLNGASNGNGILIGYNAGQHGASTYPTRPIGIGDSVAIYGSDGIAIGTQAVALGNSVAIGGLSGTPAPSAYGGTQAIAIGYSAKAETTGLNPTGSALAIGSYASASAEEVVIGSPSFPFTNVYFGSGKTRSAGLTSGSGVSYTINGAGAFGTDFAGGNLTLAGGKGTGTGSAADVIFATATTGSTGSTLQSLTNRVWIKGTTGNVGIGTSTPGSTLPNGWGSGGYVLEVLGPTNESSGIFLRRGNFIGIGLDLWSNNGGGSSYIDNRYDSSGAFGITLRIRTSGTPRTVAVFDDEFGAKLGDWTNNRANAVRVEGDLSFRSGGGPRTITGPLNTSLILNALPLNSNEGVILQYSGSTGFILNNSGNVGIGRTTPAYRLDVSGSGNFTGNLTITGSATNSLLVKGSGTTSSTTALLVQNSSNRTSFIVNDDGRVGINVAPYDSYALAVDPIAGASNVFVAQRAVANNTNEYRFVNSSGTPSAGSTAGSITWHTLAYLEGRYTSAIVDGYRTIDLRILGWSGSSAETARFTYDNKVGIGTSTPAYRLDVSGSSNFTGNVLITGSANIDGGLFDTVSTGSIPTGSTLIYTINTGSYQAGFFDYYVSSGSNFRAGNIMSVWGAGTYKFTDLATPDIGSTSNLQFSMSLSSSNLQLYASASSDGWTVKTTFRTI